MLFHLTLITAADIGETKMKKRALSLVAALLLVSVITPRVAEAYDKEICSTDPASNDYELQGLVKTGAQIVSPSANVTTAGIKFI